MYVHVLICNSTKKKTSIIYDGYIFVMHVEKQNPETSRFLLQPKTEKK